MKHLYHQLQVGIAPIANCQLPTTVLASVVQVSVNLRDAAPSNDEHSDAASHCNQYSHKTVTPKNGDRNAQWQQYS